MNARDTSLKRVSETMMSTTQSLKIILLGDRESGKRELIQCLCYTDQDTEQDNRNVRADRRFEATYTLQGDVQLKLWDTAGENILE